MPKSQRPAANLNRLAYFAAVVEAGSFTRAAERLGVTKAVVSQHVSRLEEELGVTLLLRTTRKVVPTDAGRSLHGRCIVILHESAAAFEELAEGSVDPRGTLRVTAPFDYGSSVVVPVVATFSRTYPLCNVELNLNDRIVDVQSVDLAIRVGWLRDSSHLTRRIGTFEQYLVCSTDFRRQLGRAQDPDALAEFPFVSNGSLPEPLAWHFSRAGRGRRTVRMHARITVDATPVAHAAVLAGAGLSVLPDYLVAADLAAGRLARLLPDWQLRSGGIYVVLPSARFRPTKVSRFLEAITRAEIERRRSA